MSNDKQNTENELAMAILNGLSGPNACNAADEQRRMIPLSLADQAVAACEKEITTLRAELQRLRASSFVTAVPCEEYEKLKAEVERLRKAAVTGGYNLSEYIRMANSETLEFDNGDIFAEMTLPERIKYIVNSHDNLKAEVERLRKAGDVMLVLWKSTQAGHWAIDEAEPAWNAAKDGKPSA